MNSKYHYDNNYALSPRIFNDLQLYQLGEIMCDTDTVMMPHVHLDWFEITYVFSGNGEISTNRKAPQVLQKGDFYFSHPKEIHHIISHSSDPLRYFFFAFNFDESSPYFSILEECRKTTISEYNRKFHSSSIAAHLTNLLSEISSESKIGTMICEHELKLVLLKIFQIIKSEKTTDYQIPNNNSAQVLSFKLLTYIDQNFKTMSNTSSLSKIFGYNYAYLSRCFKKVVGTPITDYVIDKKLNFAKELLERENMTITEISNMLNYSSIYAFSRSFKARFNISPNNYRQKVKK